MMTNNIALYFHIPFCIKKCDYCAFYSLENQKDEIKQEYYQALLRQIDFFETDKTVSTVYFGGGTPPILGVWRICGLIKAVKERFHISEDAEITVEVNPATVDLDDLKLLKEAGANRLSIGIQSSDDDVLKSIGRIHSFEQGRECIFNARKCGFENINADIIFALPDCGIESFEKSVTQIAETGVDHISAYSLQLEEGTPLFRRADSLVFPNEEQEEEQYEALCEILKSKGFEHYEISSFCKKGFESKHNMNYWAAGEYFGFGAGAHSFFECRRFSAKANVKDFIEKSRISLLAPTSFYESEPISPEEAEEERIMLGLRTNRGTLIPDGKKEIAERIAKMGFGCFDGERLILNSKGFRVSNAIIGMILS